MPRNSAATKLLLDQNIGKTIVIHLMSEGQNSIQQGVLAKGSEEIGSYVLRISRASRRHPHTSELIIMPESETEFFPDDVWYIQRQLETEGEAAARLKEEAGKPKIISGRQGGGGLFGGLQ